MKKVLSLMFLIFPLISLGQTKVITGKVIWDDLYIIPDVIITANNVKVGTTDNNGEFEVAVPVATDQLRFNYLGAEETLITITQTCKRLEVIMSAGVLYHGISSSKIDRLRKKAFNNLVSVYKKAHGKGIFESPSPCYTMEFIAHKPFIDSIARQIETRRQMVQLYFKTLKNGDTVQIPYSVDALQQNRANRTILNPWAAFTDQTKFDCIIRGIVVTKDKRKGSYSITYKVTDCEQCKFPSPVYEGKRVAVGEVFTHDMAIFKIITP